MSEPSDNRPVNQRQGGVCTDNASSRALQLPALSRAGSLPRAFMALAKAPGQQVPDAAGVAEAAAAAAKLKNLHDQQEIASSKHDGDEVEGKSRSGIATEEKIEADSEHRQTAMHQHQHQHQDQQRKQQPSEKLKALGQTFDEFAAKSMNGAAAEWNDDRNHHKEVPQPAAAPAHVVAGTDRWSSTQRLASKEQTWGGGERGKRLTSNVREGLIEAQYGGRGRAGRNALLARDGTVIYASLSSVIVVRPPPLDHPHCQVATREASIYNMHRFEVVCMTLHHRRHQPHQSPSSPRANNEVNQADVSIVASCDAGRAGRVLVWRSDTLETLASLPSCHAKGASILCFGGSNRSMLATVGAEPSNGPGRSSPSSTEQRTLQLTRFLPYVSHPHTNVPYN